MNIILKKFAESDIVGVIDRAEALGVLKTFLESMNIHKKFPSGIAIDNNTGDAMFLMPEFVRREDMNTRFVVFFNKDFFEIRLVSQFSGDVEIKSLHASDNEKSTFLKDFIVAAFHVYGRYGTGPKDIGGGVDELIANPVFKEVK